MRYLLVCRLKPELHLQLSSPGQLWVSKSFLCQITVVQDSLVFMCFSICFWALFRSPPKRYIRYQYSEVFLHWRIWQEEIKFLLVGGTILYSLDFIKVWLHSVFCEQVSPCDTFVFLNWHLFLFSFRLVCSLQHLF